MHQVQPWFLPKGDPKGDQYIPRSRVLDAEEIRVNKFEKKALLGFEPRIQEEEIRVNKFEKKALLGFEPRIQESKSWVLTATLQGRCTS